MRLIILAGFLALSAGCATQTPPPAARSTHEKLSPVQLDAADTAAVQAGVRKVLKDPDSARFGQMLAGADSKGDVTVCLQVNARNSYGGYTGMKPYVGILTTKKPRVFVVSGGVSTHLIEFRDVAAYKVCEDYGLVLSM